MYSTPNLASASLWLTNGGSGFECVCVCLSPEKKEKTKKKKKKVVVFDDTQSGGHVALTSKHVFPEPPLKSAL